MKSYYIGLYFDKIYMQRISFSMRMENYRERPWVRPREDKWSFGETYYHLYLMVKRFRQLNNFYLPVAKQIASRRRKASYKTEIEDIYKEYKQKKKKPMKAPSILVPPKDIESTISFATLTRELDEETKRLEQLVSAIEDDVAGHIRYPDPVAHHPNLIQAIQLIAIHEQHHFQLCAFYYDLP